jgi:renalase
LETLLGLTPSRPNPVYQAAHRWRYARVEVETGPSFLFDRTASIGACGDWLQGPRIESAWLSGHKLGQAMAGHLV